MTLHVASLLDQVRGSVHHSTDAWQPIETSIPARRPPEASSTGLLQISKTIRTEPFWSGNKAPRTAPVSTQDSTASQGCRQPFSSFFAHDSGSCWREECASWVLAALGMGGVLRTTKRRLRTDYLTPTGDLHRPGAALRSDEDMTLNLLFASRCYNAHSYHKEAQARGRSSRNGCRLILPEGMKFSNPQESPNPKTQSSKPWSHLCCTVSTLHPRCKIYEPCLFGGGLRLAIMDRRPGWGVINKILVSTLELVVPWLRRPSSRPPRLSVSLITRSKRKTRKDNKKSKVVGFQSGPHNCPSEGQDCIDDDEGPQVSLEAGSTLYFPLNQPMSGPQA